MAVTDTPTCDERDQVRCALEQTTLYAIDCGAIDAQDRRWAYNELLDAMGAEGPAPSTAWEAGTETFDEDSFDLDDALAVLSEVAVANGRFEDSAGGRDRASMAIMGRLTPRPSDIARSFEDLRREKGGVGRHRLVLPPVLRRRIRAPLGDRPQYRVDLSDTVG